MHPFVETLLTCNAAKQLILYNLDNFHAPFFHFLQMQFFHVTILLTPTTNIHCFSIFVSCILTPVIFVSSGRIYQTKIHVLIIRMRWILLQRLSHYMYTICRDNEPSDLTFSIHLLNEDLGKYFWRQETRTFYRGSQSYNMYRNINSQQHSTQSWRRCNLSDIQLGNK